MRFWIKQGFAVCTENEPEQLDLYIEEGLIRRMFPHGSWQPPGDAVEISAADALIMPGLIDLHVHFRDPGHPDKEDTASGCQAAARGGFSTVCCMPNTEPPLDNAENVLYVDRAGRQANGVHVLPVAALTRGQMGTLAVPFAELVELATVCKDLTGRGIAAVSEDGRSVDEAALMHDLMVSAANLGLPVFSHAEDTSMTGGAMHLGKRSAELGVPGLAAEAEEIIVARDILLAKATGCHLHFCHISTRGSLDLIRLGKQWGVSLTAETAPHYFTLTDEAVTIDSGLAKMNPPLRSAEDRKAIIEALADGTLDAIATDHAPHTWEEKTRSLKTSPFGIVGLETAFSLAFTELVETGILKVADLARLMSRKPAEILGLNQRGVLQEGAPADIAIFDIRENFRIDPASFESKSRNMPFAGREVKGKTLCTLVDGKIVYQKTGR
ncbi:MAG TPA: dihydroorotase [Clostridiales bacterium]|jgi:dihydroorotase|nr:dihydroorotase [Clostridiales bacterium]